MFYIKAPEYVLAALVGFDLYKGTQTMYYTVYLERKYNKLMLGLSLITKIPLSVCLYLISTTVNTLQYFLIRYFQNKYSNNDS